MYRRCLEVHCGMDKNLESVDFIAMAESVRQEAVDSLAGVNEGPIIPI